MKSIYKLGFLITLCMIQSDVVVAYQEENIGAEIVTEHAMMQNEIDQELHDLFIKFFNDHDDMPFVQFVHKIITILKTQKELLSGYAQTQCEKMIEIFEKNKESSAFHIWIPILSNPDLRDIMSHKTRTYINNISTTTKISSLMNKLRK